MVNSSTHCWTEPPIQRPSSPRVAASGGGLTDKRGPVYPFDDKRDSATPVPGRYLPGTGVSVWWSGQRDYLLSAPTRRSTSSSTLPVLGRSR